MAVAKDQEDCSASDRALAATTTTTMAVVVVAPHVVMFCRDVRKHEQYRFNKRTVVMLTPKHSLHFRTERYKVSGCGRTVYFIEPMIPCQRVPFGTTHGKRFPLARFVGAQLFPLLGLASSDRQNSRSHSWSVF